MRRDAAGVADPDARIDPGVDRQRIFSGKARDAFVGRGGTGVYARRVAGVAQFAQLLDFRRLPLLFSPVILPSLSSVFPSSLLLSLFLLSSSFFFFLFFFFFFFFF